SRRVTPDASGADDRLEAAVAGLVERGDREIDHGGAGAGDDEAVAAGGAELRAGKVAGVCADLRAWPGGDDDAARALAEEGKGEIVAGFGERDGGAHVAALDEGHREAAFGDVVGAGDAIVLDEGAEGRLQALLEGEIE